MLDISVKSLSRRAVFAAAGLLVFVVIAGTSVALWLYRNAALAGGEWHLKNIAVALAEQTRQGVLTVDMALRATAEEYGGQVAAGAVSEQVLHERMRQRVADLPQLRSLLVIGPDGGLIAHSEAFPAPQASYGDRDYFAAQRGARDPLLFFGMPVKGRVIQEWTHPVSRRVSGVNGEFLGAVAAAIDVPYFHDIYRALELGPAGRVFLFRRDGVLLTSFPPAGAALGRSFSAHGLFSVATHAAASGVLRTTGLVDEHARLIAYHTPAGYPLMVAVSSTTDYVLRDWRRQSLYAAASALVAVTIILSGAFLLARQLRVSQELAGKVAESERRWLAAVEAAGHGVWDWDVPAGRTFRSAHYHQMLGYRAEEIPATREGWLQLLHPEDRKVAHQANQACLEGRVDAFSSELRLRCKDGSWKWVLNRGMAVSRDARGRALRVLGTITDVTEHQQAQQQLRDSEARLNAIIGSAMDAIITVDEHQNIVLFNAAAEKIFRCPVHEATGASLDRFIPERFRTAHRAHIDRFGETGVTMRRMGEHIVLAGLRAEGEEFPIDASISQVEVGHQRFYTVILRDITERQKAAAALEQSHRELRELYGVMHEVREAERIRIARELHDELAQWLTALKMDISWVAGRLPGDLRPLVDKTNRMKAVVDTTVAAVRRIAADLRPAMIDDLGLVPAIESLLHEFSQRSGLLVSLETKVDDADFRDPLATALYRMVQEALTNIARHAGATRAEVSLARENGDLVVRVRDDGKGIERGLPRKEKSFGLLGIQERAQTLGGAARFYTPDEGGTVVEITIPLRAADRAEAAA
ncbi:MAG: PAS domain S-box protein [Betaproteobacteria bacterium]|nr:PAS domain S-box protein [Betaproteobacteria bacterium]